MWLAKPSRKLAQGIWILGAAAGLIGCAADQTILDPTDPATPPAGDTTAPTPSEPPQPPPAQPGVHSGYFVAPSGSGTSNGSQAQPWDLATALEGGNGRVGPGDTIWVRAGTYYAPFKSTVSGSAAAPVVIRAYPGERAVIDGVNTTADNFTVLGSYTVVWGLEFTNTAPSRSTSVINHDYRANSVVNNAPYNKYVNLIVHDVGTGFYSYSSKSTGVEVSGGVWYNIGWQAPDRGHGHALYLKADNGPLTVRDNIVFNQFGFGLHVYTNVGDGLLNNIRIEGNAVFNSGTLSTTGTSANIGNLGEPLARELVVKDNMTYMVPSLDGRNFTLGSGVGLTATNNYVVGGGGLIQDTWTGSVVKSNNTVLPSGRSSAPAKVFVRPNAYESGRANVVIYNWSGQNAVSVNLSGVLKAGDRYEIRTVQNLGGAAVVSGTYSGGSVSIPMRAVTAPKPVGLGSSRSPVTGPDFDVFIVFKQ